MDMVERVARALYKKDLDRVTPWENLSSEMSGYYNGLARAAIEAMREPTEEMTNAGLFDPEDFNLLGVHAGDFKEAYARMISAALGTQP